MKKFLCDEMCSELGRWLRTAGYDTEIIVESKQDELIFEKAKEEDRLLLTRDRYFNELDPEGKTVIYLRSDSLDDMAKQLKEEASIDWLWSPFSRCLQCNSLLQKTEISKKGEDIPNDVTDLWICQNCNHFFWRGSHTQNMENQLKEWQ